MKDIFDAKILCKNCNVEMESVVVVKSGFRLRAVQCPKCRDKIVHPLDLSRMDKYNDLKNKTYHVKLRIIGNSHAISIPKEIVDFINDTNTKMNRQMNDMVRLCFEDFGRLSLNFMDSENEGLSGSKVLKSHRKVSDSEYMQRKRWQ